MHLGGTPTAILQRTESVRLIPAGLLKQFSSFTPKCFWTEEPSFRIAADDRKSSIQYWGALHILQRLEHLASWGCFPYSLTPRMDDDPEAQAVAGVKVPSGIFNIRAFTGSFRNAVARWNLLRHETNWVFRLSTGCKLALKVHIESSKMMLFLLKATKCSKPINAPLLY